jgi:DNA repair exonuclease SbcCD ATPase subunit
MTQDPVRITTLEIENFKRLTALILTPSPTGLTTIGGDNRQGKSSAIDGIAFALGGEAFAPSSPIHDGAEKSKLLVTLSNGFTVQKITTRAGSYLTVTDPAGKKGGQTLLKPFINTFALELSDFLAANDKAKAAILLQIIGVDLQPLNERAKKLYDQRLDAGRLRDRQKHHAEAMPYTEGLPGTPLSPSYLIAEMQTILAKNAANENLRQNARKLADDLRNKEAKATATKERVAELKAMLQKAEEEMQMADDNAGYARIEASKATIAAGLTLDTDTADITAKLAEVEATNKKINANLDRAKAFDEAESHAKEYRSLDAQIDAIELQKKDLLAAAKMPLDGLTIEQDALCFKGKAWDCMSHAEQLITATAVVRNLNPHQGFVLIDKVEAIDIPTLEEFGRYLVDTGLQAITTRVSQGEECDLIITDGAIDPKHNLARLKP